MSQQEYNAIYRAPLIAFFNLTPDTQQAFLERATPHTQLHLSKMIEQKQKKGDA